MATDIVIPGMGESIPSGVINAWLKADGDYVQRDEPIIELETDKANTEITAPASGILRQVAKVGAEVPVGAVVGRVEESAAPPAGKPAPGKPAPAAAADSNAPTPPAPPSLPGDKNGAKRPGKGAGTPAAPLPAPAPSADIRATPLARKLAEEHGVDLGAVSGTGAGGRIREQDILGYVQTNAPPSAPVPGSGARAGTTTTTAAPSAAIKPGAPVTTPGGIRREKMSYLRQRIATRLVEAQHTAAMLTTFNEVDMSAVMDLRKQHKEAFEKRYGVGLGFMSFFVKACVQALQAFPVLNASIVQGESGGGGAGGGVEVEYHDSCDIAIAVGTPKGLVVPVLRNCQALTFAQIEAGVKDLAARAREGKLNLAELQGGTFTITNGGIYGSLMSTPILNPPQSGILGMHAIKNRPVEDPKNPGQVALRPMMYLAMSYDHRLIDGTEAVRFLIAIKHAIEEPQRLLLGL